MPDVLIVEDNFSTRRNIVRLLEKSGYKVFSAESGEDALGVVENQTPDLIISDIMMPGMDGFELFANVNGEDKEDHIPFIFLTARTDASDYRQGMLTGADDYITKPFKANDLLKSVEIRLKKKAKLQKKIDGFKRNLTRNISHEFRTPLVPIIGYSRMIREDYWELKPDEILEMTERINSSGNWMLKMIEKFLLLVELEENAAVVEENSSSLKEAVDESINRVRSLRGNKNNFIVNIPDASIKMPPSHLKRILTELIENAVRFSNSDSPVEIISMQQGDYHIVTITDFGKGMTSDQIKYISSFLQFSRDGMHRAGMGLGLAIVKRLAQLNNAGLNIESEPGMFTKVLLRLHPAAI